MPYAADISRNNPSCFLFLVDQSASMSGALGGQPGLRKSNGAADALNRILDAVSQRCSQGMEVRDYFDAGIITYTTYSTGETDLGSVFPGTTPDQPFLKISEIAEVARVEDKTVRESDGAGGIVEVNRKFPVWLDPASIFGTPMCAALEAASTALEEWIENHPNSYPPMVINISDGEASDGDPEPIAWRIMDMQTSDGNVLLYNAHLSEMSVSPVQFPTDESELPPDDYAKSMFRMSSPFPEPVWKLAESMGLPAREGSRGYVFNADMVSLVQFLDIGTRAASDLQ